MTNRISITYQQLASNIDSFYDATHTFEKCALRICTEHEVPLVILVNYRLRAVAVGYSNSNFLEDDEEKFLVAQCVPSRLLQLINIDVDRFDALFQQEVCMRISTCQQLLKSVSVLSVEDKAYVRHLLTTQTIFTADLKVND